MKFLDQDVRRCAEQMEKQMKEMNQIFSDLRNGLDFITSSNYWIGNTNDYYVKKLKELYSNFDNLSYISTNVNSYLNGVIENYRQFEEKSSLNFLSKRQ